MRTMRRAAILVSSIIACQTICAALPAHSVSPSRQFIIYGGDARLRGTVSELAEQTKSNLLSLIGERDEWKTSVIVNLLPQQANLPEIPVSDLRVTQTGFSTKLQVDLTVGQNLDGSLVERQLLRGVLLEMMYRNGKDLVPGSKLVEPPDWLVEGALALAPGRSREGLLEALSTTTDKKSLQEFLGRRFDLLDSAGRMLYRAYSAALVQVLLENGGHLRLAKYIANLSHGSKDPVADLKVEFPRLRADLEKKWRAQVTRLAERPTYHLLTFTESERRLDELLRIKVSANSRTREQPRTVDLSELAERKASLDEKAAVAKMSRELLLFIGMAHPVLRPVAREYQAIASLLVRGRRKGIEKRLSRLDSTRKQLASRMVEIDDYMNWFEATQMQRQSGAFTDYLKAATQAEVPPPRRRDPLSIYLDALADHFEN
ncbi:MAG TPA: hypothetical protein VFA51_07630 [Candidatus Udaeobacter sp.]|nr:hypothetical protein [Candidatus Udaeobacter sp.]